MVNANHRLSKLVSRLIFGRYDVVTSELVHQHNIQNFVLNNTNPEQILFKIHSSQVFLFGGFRVTIYSCFIQFFFGLAMQTTMSTNRKFLMWCDIVNLVVKFKLDEITFVVLICEHKVFLHKSSFY